MFSRHLESTLNRALYIAKKFHHEYATYEHLLLSLLEDDDVLEFLQYTKCRTQQIRHDLEEYLTQELSAFETQNIEEAVPTAGFQRIVHRAVLHSNSLSQAEVTGINLLAEFFFEHEAYALACLKEHNLTRPYILNYITEHYAGNAARQTAETYTPAQPLEQNITNITEHPRFTASQDESELIKHTDQKTSKNTTEPPALKKFCTNLNKKAAEEKIDKVIGRDSELMRVIEILARRHKNNPLLVGEPGVGKTAIAEGLALNIHQQQSGQALSNATIYALDLPSVISGTKYRGDFEERITNIIDIFHQNPDYILFIDEIHMLMGAGSTSAGGMDTSNILKPALARGEIRCIGATTFHEYHTHFEKDAALARRFQKVIVDEPTIDETLEILQGLKSYYEKYHNVQYHKSALEAAIYLSEKYIHDKNLPDKAIELLDDAAARKKIITTDKDKKTVIVVDDIHSTISAITRVPSVVGADDDLQKLAGLEQKLQESIFGQEYAISTVCNIIKMSKAGLRKRGKPIGSFLFAGTTGVGKTELAKKLAHIIGMKLLKFDMSEYADINSISRLLGAAPGYTGYEKGGLLTEAISRNPHSILLLDEIEKAHPGIYNLLLQMLDEGQLTDSAGKVVNCSHTMIILTSNLASDAMHKKSVGFAPHKSDIQTQALNEIKVILPDELHSRLDEIIIFNKLNEKTIDQIVQQELSELSAQLADNKVKLTTTNKAKELLRQNMLHSIDTGIRTLKRIIDNDIRRKCAEEILFGSLKNGGNIEISAINGEITCTIAQPISKQSTA